MKCDLREVQNRDGEEVYVPCSRDRVTIMKTRFGRLGLCQPCRFFAQKALSQPPAEGEVVELENGSKGRKAPAEPIRLRRGFVVVDKLPSEVPPS